MQLIQDTSAGKDSSEFAKLLPWQRQLLYHIANNAQQQHQVQQNSIKEEEANNHKYVIGGKHFNAIII